MNLEARLPVEDSPNSAGVVIDAIRCAKLSLDRKIGGPLDGASAFMMKHPQKQMRDSETLGPSQSLQDRTTSVAASTSEMEKEVTNKLIK